MRALISVYDKTGIVELARRLHDREVELVSTGGTHRTLSEDGGLPVRQVSDLTGFPEILEGRVKTLHPSVHAGLLARRDSQAHVEELAGLGIGAIDLVVVNLYPFVQTVSRPDVTLDEALENIDIGGPAMLRAGAKNYPAVTVVVDPSDYGWVADRIMDSGPSMEERRHLAFKAFQHVSEYDRAVASYLGGYERPEIAREGSSADEAREDLPQDLVLRYARVHALRYGENPHQSAALYRDVVGGGIAEARQLHGKELSYNNLMDADAAWRTVSDFQEPTVAVIKHANPCGLACRPDLAEAYRRAHAGDPVSAFGGIVGFNRTITAEAARAMSGVFYEVVVAPDYEPEALEVLAKRKNLRVLSVSPPTEATASPELRPVSGGVLAQTPDNSAEDPTSWRVVTGHNPSPAQLRDLAFAWRAVKHVKSNAIVLVTDEALIGVGAGQPNRVNSVHLALRAAGDSARGSVLASDAFFPFPDSILSAAEGGIAAIAQPGGSIRDEEVIAEADRHGIAMVFTGVRHFRH